MRDKKKPNSWSWSSAVIGGAATAVATAVIMRRPKDPTFDLISLKLTSLKLNFPHMDVDLTLTVHVTNPNIASVHYSSTEMSIFYSGTKLGSAKIESGSQDRNSCKVLKLPARLSGLELAKFIGDVKKREMFLDAEVDIQGSAKVFWWDHRFKVHVDSHVTVDPVFLHVIHQESKSQMKLLMLGGH